MIYPHVIRLRHPWNKEDAEDGTTRWQRKFNRPTGLSERERVWLVLSFSQPTEAVTVNGRPLEAPGLEWDVTEKLDDYNEIVIVTSSTSDRSTAHDDSTVVEEGVAIEIRLAPAKF